MSVRFSTNNHRQILEAASQVEMRLQTMSPEDQRRIRQLMDRAIQQGIGLVQLKRDVNTFNERARRGERGVNENEITFGNLPPKCLTPRQQFDKLLVKVVFSPVLLAYRGYSWIAENKEAILNRAIQVASAALFCFVLFRNQDRIHFDINSTNLAKFK